MGLILAVVVVVALLWVATAVFGSILSAIGALIIGLFIGAIARLIIPGRQEMGLLATALFGAAGGLIGNIVAAEVFGWGDFGQFMLALGAAVALIAVFAASTKDRARYTA